MTRERAKELAPIIAAFSEGKKIRCRPKNKPSPWRVNDGEGLSFYDDWEYEIVPEPKTRPMTRGEVLYILSAEHVVLQFVSKTPFLLAEALAENVDWIDEAMMPNIELYEYAIIDKQGNPVDGWHKFEVTE